MIKPVKIGALVVASALALAACGSSSSGSSASSGKSFVVGTDLPLQGSNADTSTSINDMIKLYLEQQGGKAGDYSITLKTYDNSTAAKGGWDDAACAKNAQDHVANTTELAVMGTQNSGCAKIIVPVLNQDPNGPMLMVSGANTNPGLTKTWDAGEPDKYYPTGKRNYGRIIVADDLQGAVAAQYVAETLKLTKCAVLDDKVTYGQGIAKATADAMPKNGITVVVKDSWDAKQTSYKALFQKIKTAGAECVFLAGDYESNGGQVIKDARAVLGTSFPLLADTGFSGYADLQKMPEAEGLYLLASGLSQSSIIAKSAAAAKIVADYKTKYGKEPMGAWSIQQTAAFQVILAAIAASDGTRADVVKKAFEVSIPADKSLMGGVLHLDANGDTTDRTFTFMQMKSGVETDVATVTIK